jgi:S-adenosylmethionine synthetase
MFEKVNPMHPDKVADRIAGAVVDLAYKTVDDPKIAVEVLIGHGVCHIIAESSVDIDAERVANAVHRITERPDIITDFKCVKQDEHLNKNQQNGFRCGDNGIFKGVPLTSEQTRLTVLARNIYNKFPTDGKYILSNDKLIICQSNATAEDISKLPLVKQYKDVAINPLGYWTGGTDVDTGATNRKLGSDMADSVTGGGLHGKDLSKADVSANIYAFMKAQRTREVVNICCAIGDTHIDGVPYEDIVNQARRFIASFGGFEKFAEWGLV